MKDDPFSLFRDLRNPQQDARILGSVEPSDFIPSPGKFYRVRFATIADRTYMNDIWECVGFQSHTAIGRKVLDGYCGLDDKRIGEIRAFVHGDVIFYDCTEAWEEMQRRRSAPSESDERV